MTIITWLRDNWTYSSAPEGERPFEKVVGLSKYGLFTGLLTGGYDCILLSQAYTFWEALNCVSYWMVPMTAMCATFASVAYTTTKVRGKDGYANYVVASLATSGIFHRWQKNGRLTYSFTVILLAAAMIKKHGDMIGWNPFPYDIGPDYIRSQHTTFPGDFTFTKDPRGRRPWE